ncbi:uncharacterized protein EDB91DRAFT_1154568 [Suillus paluster]|uniref:uncharacterized protein n=1 Tax=Suillus paluster TaxID=48578 RepID=UPI001B866CD7|nr:uncharacterized protein EDB91DRAFT_1154568 [Suillus paluster]KAG1731332.1 hypothetical protein EDB91DRAFT_1154568 [Suillus paluster]
MSSTAISTITYPCPPPTTNTLDSQQRMRLIRSARKLEAIMGTTPYLLEADIPVTLLPVGGNKKSATGKALKRQGSISMHYHTFSPSVTSFSSASTTSLHSPSASLVSLPSSMRSTESLSVTPPGLPARGRRSADKPRPLYLRMNNVPVSPTDHRCTSPPSTPSSASPTSDSFPSTPRTPRYDAAEVRRKRMAKLARHLGENVPPELVTAQGPPPKLRFEEDVPNRTRRSMSVNHASPQNIPFAPKPQANSDWVGEWNRSDIRDVQRELRNLRAERW